MSSNATPISPARFAAALTPLPLSNLYLKAAEIRNSITHLKYSNLQLQPLAEDGGDPECKAAIEENKLTIARMEERIQLLKVEIESRGFNWAEQAPRNDSGDGEQNGAVRTEVVEYSNEGRSEAARMTQVSMEDNRLMNGDEHRRLADEELARRLQERMNGDMLDSEDDGLHL